LAIAAINLKADKKDDIDNVKMAKITSASKIFEKILEDDLKKYSQNIAKFSSE